MRYRITNIGLGSASRLAGLIGLAVSLVPSMLIAGAVVAAARRAQAAFERLAGFSVTIPDQQIGPLTLQLPPLQLDLVDRLGLGKAALSVASVAASPGALFVGLTLGLTLLGAVLWLCAAAVAVLIYNFVAPRSGGIEVRLARDGVSSSKSQVPGWPS